MRNQKHILLGLVMVLSGRLVAEPDLILHHGRVVTVDQAFSIKEAIAVSGNRISAVGLNEAVLSLRGPKTRVVDLQGRMLLPGLIDSHVHPEGASHDRV